MGCQVIQFTSVETFPGGKSENSVCPCPLLQFLQFTSVRLRQVTSGYGGVIFHMFSATHQNASGVRGDTGVRETGVLG